MEECLLKDKCGVELIWFQGACLATLLYGREVTSSYYSCDSFGRSSSVVSWVLLYPYIKLNTVFPVLFII